jgi:hypothetical protein
MKTEKLNWKWRIIGLLLCPVALLQSSMPLQERMWFYLDPEKCWNAFWHGTISV